MHWCFLRRPLGPPVGQISQSRQEQTAYCRREVLRVARMAMQTGQETDVNGITVRQIKTTSN